MANTYTSLNYHIIFSTKNRREWIKQDLEQRIWEYIGGIARQHGMMALKVRGVEDHIHALINSPPINAPSRIAQILKGESSKWIHETFATMRWFSWQDGYGAFSVGKRDLAAVVRYIENQREHHRRKTFQEEYLELLRAYGIQYDDRYVWG